MKELGYAKPAWYVVIVGLAIAGFALSACHTVEIGSMDFGRRGLSESERALDSDPRFECINSGISNGFSPACR